MKLILPLPPSVNATYKIGNGRFYKSREARDWEREAGHMCLKNKKTFSGPIYVGLEWFLKRDCDIDNRLKILFDLLQKQRIIENDILITHLNVKKYMDKKNPRCEITIELVV